MRLKEVATLGIPIIEYPLPEVLAKIKFRSVGSSWSGISVLAASETKC